MTGRPPGRPPDRPPAQPLDAARFLSRDHDYCRRIVEENAFFVLGVCRLYARDHDHAEDLYQETWLKAYEKARTYRATGSFRAWLGRLARNVCVSDYRSRTVAAKGLELYAGEHVTDDPAGRQRDPFEERERAVLQRTILDAIDDLPQREGQALTLRLIDEKRPREVARIMHISPATVRSHVRHAFERLRKRIADPADELSALNRFRPER